MENYKNKLENQLREIDALIARSDKHLERLQNLPDERIGAVKSNGCDQYLWIDRNSGKRRYAKRSEMFRRLLIMPIVVILRVKI